MKKYIAITAICFVTATVHAGETTATTGKKLHAENCLSCHKPELYIKAERKVTSKDKLSTQVHMCVSQLQLAWFDEEIESVTKYLNNEFYNFK